MKGRRGEMPEGYRVFDLSLSSLDLIESNITNKRVEHYSQCVSFDNVKNNYCH